MISENTLVASPSVFCAESAKTAVDDRISDAATDAPIVKAFILIDLSWM
jgi:hypothetical protein